MDKYGSLSQIYEAMKAVRNHGEPPKDEWGHARIGTTLDLRNKAETDQAMRTLWDNGYRVFTWDGAEIIDQRKNKDTPND